MKNLNKLSLVSLIGLLSFTSCSRDTINTDNNGGGTNTVAVKAENDFVWKGLNSWYYWQKDVPGLADSFKNSSDYATTLNAKTPDALFYSFLYKYKVVDRYSWIELNGSIQRSASLSAAVTKSNGLDYSLFGTGNGGVVGVVNYVTPNSSAAAAGIQRGDAIIEVNGATLSTSNYTTLQSDSYSITFRSVGRNANNELVPTSDKKTANLVSVEVNENPVAYYKLFNTNTNGKRVGYLVYNGFKADFNGELNAAFAQMKRDNVTDIILDLRYNGGGSVETAVALGTMISGQVDKPYINLKYNDKHTRENGAWNLKSTVNLYQKGNTLVKTGSEAVNALSGVGNVYVLTNEGTASASELTFDALRVYTNVTTIGDPTYGKFVGSITLYDSPGSDYTDNATKNTKHNWTMQPIVFAYWNSRNDAHPVPSTTTDTKSPDYNPNGGILPSAQNIVREVDCFGRMKEFGNTADPALAKALERITGVVQPSALVLSASTVKNGTASLKPMISSDTNLRFVASRKTLTPYGTDVYINNFKQK
ncbi:protease [Elizabethkingia anophelis]|uniref:S41 family peptidase n=1 Tax=Elizabethkingia anophelis TaxID=1117645 RepID=UPI000999BA9D|nr:S41 family peptidase [Elizabethkingia anophelis]MDV3895578.1 protease [Elizabethkingia anophelis]MDV3917777.1 protease [Elizabethkingia anophelis]MDV3918301.1 protease [Elizabethkingia anophelis]MDV3935333.1 protease [Elizabethkingia anophelis]MDV3960025.1 protease [Elizabethkingia anophelis]